MTNARLLIVDDDQDNLEMFTVILSEKYRVSSYGYVADALTALEVVKPDLLLLDIGMRPVDGMQCLQAIRARPGYARTPAVALTAFARDVERNTFLAAGFQAVVTKPILDHLDFMQTLDTLLQSPAWPSPGAGSEPCVNGAGHQALTRPIQDGIMRDRGRGTTSQPGAARAEDEDAR